MNTLREALSPVQHGIAMGIMALIFGALWAAYIATHHEALHGGFEASESKMKQAKLTEAQADMSMSSMHLEGRAYEHSTASVHNHSEAPASIGHSEHAHEEEAQHSHSGSLAKDAMQRLLRGHIHFMGIGILIMVTLIVVAATNLKDHWKKTFSWTFGLGALMYPPAWILMGFRTVELGPQGAEASVMWLFGPAVALLLGSLIALFAVFAIECIGLKNNRFLAWAFDQNS